MLRKKVYAAAPGTSLFFGPGRPEFDPQKKMPSFHHYLKEATARVKEKAPHAAIDEGVIGSFMSGRFLKQANLPGFLPYLLPELSGKPCQAVEGACGTGGRALAAAIRSVLSDLADTVFVIGFEVQNGVKSVYGADILAGAAFYEKERQKGHAFFFPGIFSDRAGAYFKQYGEEKTRKGMAKWYEQAILNARQYPLAQEYHNQTSDLFKRGMTLPNPETFLPYLNLYHCSKVTDGAAALLILSEEGLKKSGIPLDQAVEIIGMGESQGNIDAYPEDSTFFENNANAVKKALAEAHMTLSDIGCLEIHDCFAISALIALESIGATPRGHAAEFILEGHTASSGSLPTNVTGGLIGFGHPTGASGIRQMGDLISYLTSKKATKPFGLMVSMGGNDRTVSSFAVKT